MKNRYQGGFTIMELLIAAAILAILASIAINSYMDYIDTSRQGTARANIGSAKILLEDRFLDDSTYANVSDDLSNIGWVNEGGFVTDLTAKSATGYTIRSVGGGVTVTCIMNRTAATFTCS